MMETRIHTEPKPAGILFIIYRKSAGIYHLALVDRISSAQLQSLVVFDLILLCTL